MTRRRLINFADSERKSQRETSTRRKKGEKLGERKVLLITSLRFRSVDQLFRGADDSKGRSRSTLGERPEEGSDIKDSLGTGLKIRSQGFVEPATLHNGRPDTGHSAAGIFSSLVRQLIRREDPPPDASSENSQNCLD